MPSLQCQTCGAAVTLDEPIPRDSECASCRTDLRCCRNCRHYDPRVHNQCRETEAEMVEVKTRRNFCEYFSFTRAPFAGKGSDAAREAKAREKLEGLFGGAPAPGASRSARDKLEGLFGGGSSSADREREARRKLEGLFGKPPPEPEED